MTIRQLLILATMGCALLLLASCDRQSGRSVTVPVTLDHNRMLVDAEIQKKDGSWQKVRLWVDSGNPDFLISGACANDLGMDTAMQRGNVEVPPPTGVRIGGMALNFEGVKSNMLNEPRWAIVPMAPVMNYSDEHPLDTLTLSIYPAEGGEASFTLYEDDGKTLEYQKGRNSFTTSTQRSLMTDTHSTLKVIAGKSRGGFAGKLKERTNIFEIHGVSQKPLDVRCNGAAVAERGTPGNSSAMPRTFWYDATAHKLFIQVLCGADSSYGIDAKYP